MIWVGTAIVVVGLLASNVEWWRATRHLTPEGEARRWRVAYVWKWFTPRRSLTPEGERHRQHSAAWLAAGVGLGLLWIILTAVTRSAP